MQMTTNLIPEKSGATPKWFNGYSYLTVMGSRAYNTNTPDSDWDFYGFCVPPVNVLFPHVAGQINGFGRNVQNFEQMQFQHLPHDNMKEYDITIYSIVRYFQLCMEGNPNMIDSLFTPDYCVKFNDSVGKMVRANRSLFLSQKCYHTFKGMLYSHVSRLKSNHTKEGRMDNLLKYGWDTKDGYHSMRMLLELSEMMYTGELNLDRSATLLKEIRNGKYPKEWVVDNCERSLAKLESEQDKFVLPYAPDESAIKLLLVECIEEKYGSLTKYGFGY
jgi:predicted nucleotidyltransferase